MKHPATIRALKAEIVTLALAWYDDPYGRRDDLKAAIVHLRVATKEANTQFRATMDEENQRQAHEFARKLGR